MLETLAKKEPENYQTFINEFGEVLKEGAGEDFANREAILKLLRFSTSTDPDEEKHVGLSDYLERMVEGQDKIYYLVADSREAAKSSPHLEVFKKKGMEVVLLFDRIDEWMMSNLQEFDGKPFVDVMRGDLQLPGEDALESLVVAECGQPGDVVAQAHHAHRPTSGTLRRLAQVVDQGGEADRAASRKLLGFVENHHDMQPGVYFGMPFLRLRNPEQVINLREHPRQCAATAQSLEKYSG